METTISYNKSDKIKIPVFSRRVFSWSSHVFAIVSAALCRSCRTAAVAAAAVVGFFVVQQVQRVLHVVGSWSYRCRSRWRCWWYCRIDCGVGTWNVQDNNMLVCCVLPNSGKRQSLKFVEEIVPPNIVCDSKWKLRSMLQKIEKTSKFGFVGVSYSFFKEKLGINRKNWTTFKIKAELNIIYCHSNKNQAKVKFLWQIFIPPVVPPSTQLRDDWEVTEVKVS